MCATNEINRAMVCGLGVLLALFCGIAAAGAEEPASGAVDADILLRGGTLHLGDGRPPVIGDVALREGRIVGVGTFPQGQVKQIIPCEGLLVSPGFIDLHNHSDGPVLRSETRAVMNYLTQGCTTIVTGNCGGGPIDVAAYYGQLDELGVGVNVAHLLPQGNLRGEVVGQEQRPATPEELQQMRTLSQQAMRDGAWGMSSGLIYVPSSYADTQELAEIATVVGQHGGIYASHIRGEGTELLDSVAEALDIGRRANVPVHISHFKSSGKDSWGMVRTAVEVIQAQRDAGQRITADQYPYTASSTSLSATFIPAWARAGGRKKTLERIDGTGPEAESIRAAIAKKLELTDGGHRIQIASFPPRPQWAGKRLDEIASAQGMEPLAMVLDIERQGGASIVNHSIDEQDVRFVMTQPWVATASDGASRIPSDEIPHPRSYGTFPRKLGFYAIREQAVPLPQAIRSCSGLPADILGMT
ncbi:MAG: amidohydrolase family protein, partial [Planctomycetales bacterium]|nr:amidohydrolase family protein [Planctomycetales bacterium]